MKLIRTNTTSVIRHSLKWTLTVRCSWHGGDFSTRVNGIWYSDYHGLMGMFEYINSLRLRSGQAVEFKVMEVAV